MSARMLFDSCAYAARARFVVETEYFAKKQTETEYI